MKHKKSVFKPLLVSCECFDGTSTGIAPNVPSIAAVADLELQNLKIYTNVE